MSELGGQLSKIANPSLLMAMFVGAPESPALLEDKLEGCRRAVENSLGVLNENVEFLNQYVDERKHGELRDFCRDMQTYHQGGDPTDTIANRYKYYVDHCGNPLSKIAARIGELIRTTDNLINIRRTEQLDYTILAGELPIEFAALASADATYLAHMRLVFSILMENDVIYTRYATKLPCYLSTFNEILMGSLNNLRANPTLARLSAVYAGMNRAIRGMSADAEGVYGRLQDGESVVSIYSALGDSAIQRAKSPKEKRRFMFELKLFLKEINRMMDVVSNDSSIATDSGLTKKLKKSVEMLANML
jgi:hypothetical protein